MRVALLAITLGACADNPPECICEDYFKSIAVQIDDAAGNPATDVVTKTVRTSDGLDLTPRSTYDPPTGSYWLIDDAADAALSAPAMITFTATAATGSATLEGIASLSDCGCHVQFDGPTSLRLVQH